MKKALIFGATGQDGSYLSSQLIAAGYSVHCVSRQHAPIYAPNHIRLGLSDKANYYSIDYLNTSEIDCLLEALQPEEVYILIGPSSVSYSFSHPAEVLQIIPSVTLSILNAVRVYSPSTRIYHAASSECFGEMRASTGTTINDPFDPKSPYALAKVHSHNILKYYREQYNIYACSGFLFNHESPLRSNEFVTKKIVGAACRISLGLLESLTLGRVDISRDWGYAPEYTQAMNLMLKSDVPRDFVICTGHTHTLQYFVDLVFECLDLPLDKYISLSNSHCRPNDISVSKGDPRHATHYLNWSASTSLPALVDLLVADELSRLSSV